MPRLSIHVAAGVFLLAVGAPRAVAQAGGHEPPPETPRAIGPGVNTGRIGALIAAAAPGDTIEIGPGLYAERLYIDKPIRLIGRDRPVIDGAGSGDIVEIAAPGVTLAGFVVRNTGIDLDRENCAIRVGAPKARVEGNTLENVLFGIDLRDAHDAVVRANRIGGKDLDIARRGDGLRLWRSDRVLIEDNVIHDGRDAILWYSQGVTVRGNRALNCRYGFHLMYSDGVVLENNEVAGNSVGVYFMYSKDLTLRNNRLIRNRGPSGYGLGLKETDRFTIEGNLIAGNRVGVYIDGSPFTTARPGEFFGNVIACNDVGMTFLPSVRGNELSGNSFIDNFEQVSVGGRGELRGNDFALHDRGNFWSDYTGYDRDRDGIGDWEHESSTLFENLLDREPRLRVLLFSPAQQAIEFVGRALPAIRPEPKFYDPAPLMQPPPAPAGMAVQPGPSSLALAGAGLIGAGGGLVLLAGPGSWPWRRARAKGGGA